MVDLAARCRALAATLEATPFGATLRATSFGATIRATSLAETKPATGPIDEPPTALPRLSLAGDDPAESDAVRWPVADGPDLTVVGLIGEGGMGRVLAARQRSLRRDVALKTVRGGSRRAAHALVHEGVLTGTLEHPNIVPVHAIGCDERGRPWMVMKRIEGVSWATLLEEPDHPAWAAIEADRAERLPAHLRVLEAICNALHFAHERGIVHRDVKPENVMIGAFGEIYLVDWGIAARVGQPDPSLAGTPVYMAPEMVLGEPLDARTDVYLLGATLHELVTGQPPHLASSLEAVLVAAGLSAPCDYPATVPAELRALCHAALHRDKDQRPATALAFRRLVGEHLRHRGALALVRTADACLAASAGDRTALLTEARFGYRQALREFPESEEARAGLARCLDEMVRRELAQGDVEGARALLAERPTPDADLARAVEDAAAAAARERAHGEELRALERDLDPTVGRSARTRTVIVSFSIYFTLSVATIVWRKNQFSPESLLAFAGLVAVTLGALLAYGGRRIFANAYSRRMIGLAVIASAGLCIDRVVGVLRRVPVDQIFAQDMTLFAAVSAVGALTLERWLARVSLVYLAAAAVTVAVPGSGAIAFTSSACVVGVILVRSFQGGTR